MLETQQQQYNILDVRELPRPHREFRQLEALSSLSTGCSFILNCDEFPESLIRYLETSDRFQWRTLERGPDLWRVLITRKFYGQQKDQIARKR
jgi:uncharacterized protein (DUF2249 family)